jgi:hypothetical protein
MVAPPSASALHDTRQSFSLREYLSVSLLVMLGAAAAAVALGSSPVTRIVVYAGTVVVLSTLVLTVYSRVGAAS